MTKRAFVLLSGGVDSTTCLHRAVADFAPPDVAGSKQLADRLRDRAGPPVYWVEALSIDYGQRHRKEMEYAARTCAKFGIKHSVMHLGGILSGAGVMLTDAAVAIPRVSYDEIKGVSPTYVPFRNGTLLSLVTAYAQKWVNAEITKWADIYASSAPESNQDNQYAGFTNPAAAKKKATDDYRDSVGIYFGAHAEDAANWAYPDCTPEFIGAMANAIYVGTYGCARLYTPIQWSGKADVIWLGEALGVDWASTWSCYAGGELHCGECPTCRARSAGFRAAGVADPTEYAVRPAA